MPRRNQRRSTQSRYLHNRRLRANTVHCLVTGFDAFSGQEKNPSAIVAQSMPEHLRQDDMHLHVRGQVLPTASRGGWLKLKAVIDETVERAVAVSGDDASVVILMTGVAASREKLNLERFALNVRDYGIPDNEGVLAVDSFVDPGEQDLLRTMLPLPVVQERLQAAGFPNQISNHAGTYICNEMYFRALSYCRRIHQVKAVLFVHVPSLDKFAATAEMYGSLAVSRQAFNAVSAPSRQAKLLTSAITSALKAAVYASRLPVPVSEVY